MIIDEALKCLDGAEAYRRDLLVANLSVAVPLWAQRWSWVWPEHRLTRARQCAGVVAEHGDQILFRTKRAEKPGTAYCFNRLAEGVAIASLQPGGITVFGAHFENQPDAGTAAH